MFSAYSSSTTYYAYTQDNYNNYVTATVGGKVRLFKAKITSIGQAPSIGSEYWEIADTCSKTLTGCKKRYGFNPLTNKISNFILDGIVDPIKVIRLSLQHAASASGSLLTTGCTVALLND